MFIYALVCSKIPLPSCYPLYNHAKLVAQPSGQASVLKQIPISQKNLIFRMSENLQMYVNPLLLPWGDLARFVSSFFAPIFHP